MEVKLDHLIVRTWLVRLPEVIEERVSTYLISLGCTRRIRMGASELSVVASPVIEFMPTFSWLLEIASAKSNVPEKP